jgi:flagellar biosynthetic protein FlhB
VLLDWSTQVVGDLTWQLAAALFAGFAPLLGALVVVALLGNLGQTGFSIAARPLEERFQAFNPAEGFKRLFSRRSFFELGKGLLKLIGVGVTAYMVLRTSVPTTLRLAEQPFQQAVGIAGGLTWELLMKTGAVLLVTAIGDYAYQRWEFERSLRMSRQELKQELKETEGNPQLRARRRSQQRSMARKRMLAAAAEADVVIVNPTHLAVALGYEEVRDPAPVVLAKGRGYMALRIRQLADENEIPIMEEPIVARTLYRTVEVGQHIPPEMYRAVAEILALVWSMTGREKPAL